MKLSEIILGLGCIGLLFLIVFQPYIFSNPAESAKVLKQQGYTDIKFTGVDYWGCGSGDSTHDGFEATNTANNKQSITVCRGFSKGSTLRFR